MYGCSLILSDAKSKRYGLLAQGFTVLIINFLLFYIFT